MGNLRSAAVLFILAGCSSGGATNDVTDAAPQPQPGSPDAGPDIHNAGCPLGTGPTLHSSVNSAETWTAAESPHVLRFDVTLYVPVTLEPCAELRFPPGSTMTIRGAGKLIAEGTADRPIHITNDVAGK